MALWQYQQKSEPLVVQGETDIDTKAWRPVLPENVPRLLVLPMATQAGAVFTPQHEATEGNALDWVQQRPDWFPPIPQTRPSGGVLPSLAGAVTDWTPRYPDWLPWPVPLRPSGVTWTAQHSDAEGAALDWTARFPDWFVVLPRPRPNLVWSTFTPAVVADVDWLPCVWMEEGVEEAMVASGTTAYQEQEADVLRLNGDPVTLNGEPIRVVS